MKLGIYRHYKGKEYRVIGIAKRTSDLQETVVYEALYENPESQLWTRPVLEFQAKVEVDGALVNRFAYIKNNE